MTDETGTKVVKAKIVLEGADEYRERIQHLDADTQNLNDCIHSVNNSMERFIKIVREFSKQVQQAEDIPDEQIRGNELLKELNDAIGEYTQKFRDETGTGVRVLIAEFEELMFLRTKLLTQRVIAEQQMQGNSVNISE